MDRKQGLVGAKTIFDSKAKIRRAIEAEGIPHTYVVANILARKFIPTEAELAAPLDKLIIFGDGNTKGTNRHNFASRLELRNIFNLLLKMFFIPVKFLIGLEPRDLIFNVSFS